MQLTQQKYKSCWSHFLQVMWFLQKIKTVIHSSSASSLYMERAAATLWAVSSSYTCITDPYWFWKLIHAKLGHTVQLISHNSVNTIIALNASPWGNLSCGHLSMSLPVVCTASLYSHVHRKHLVPMLGLTKGPRLQVAGCPILSMTTFLVSFWLIASCRGNFSTCP